MELTMKYHCQLRLGIAADAHADWPRWRGPDDSGGVEKGNYPTDLGAEKLQWRVGLPGKGCSTPIVWNRNIYLTAPANGQGLHGP